MSEADEDAAVAGKTEIWIEKYRPERLDDVKGHPEITSRLKRYVEDDDLSHMLFAGPAGTGKCLTGTTPVLTDDGLEPIGDLVGDVDGFATPADDRRVLTFCEDGRFEFTAPESVFGKRAEETVTVETRDGGESTVTPEHRLLVLESDGFDWRRADSLDPGDRVVRPLDAPVPEADAEIDWIEAMDGERTFVTVTESFAREQRIPPAENFVGLKRDVLRARARGASVETIAENLDAKPATVRTYVNETEPIESDISTTCSLAYLRSLGVSRARLREAVESIEYVSVNNGRSTPITPPWEMTPALARFVGLLVSEARIDAGRVRFYNTDEELLDAVETVLDRDFGLDPKRMERKGVPFVRCISRTLTHYLESCFDVLADDGTIASTVLTADEETRAAFLRAVFDAEGHLTENGILELTQKDDHLITALSYALASFGIPSRRKTVEKSATNGTNVERTYQTLLVSGGEALARFEESIGFTVDRKTARLATVLERDPNPNHDTIPAQSAVDELCDRLALSKQELTTRSLDPDTPGRTAHLADLRAVVDASMERLEDAQGVLERLERLETELDRLDALPTQWIDSREELAPLEVRKDLAAEMAPGTSRLLEYSDGRRTPYARRAMRLLSAVDAAGATPAIEAVQRTLRTAIDDLGVSDNRIAEGTDLLGTDVRNALTHDDLALRSLPRFRTIADRVRAVASEMLSRHTLERVHLLASLARGTLYFDEVTAVEESDDPTRVYDLTVPETHNFVAGRVPTVMHNTASAVSIAKEIYGDDWRENFLELNASDQRGIDVVRDRIKSFARTSFGGYSYRIIFLDEADALTSDAQSALRRTMEQFSNNTRFILSCNYSSQIIDPIQSRCAVFRFSPLGDDAVAAQVREIADAEGIDITEDGIEAITYAADGDMRKAINDLQAAAVLGERVDEDAVFSITSTARPEEVEAMVRQALDGEFVKAREALDELLVDKGIAGGDVIDQLHRSAWEFDLDDDAAVRLLERVGEADYRITQGANERLQLEALLASLAGEA